MSPHIKNSYFTNVKAFSDKAQRRQREKGQVKKTCYGAKTVSQIFMKIHIFVDIKYLFWEGFTVLALNLSDTLMIAVYGYTLPREDTRGEIMVIIVRLNSGE